MNIEQGISNVEVLAFTSDLGVPCSVFGIRFKRSAKLLIS